jgi:GAF domain-containing protein
LWDARSAIPFIEPVLGGENESERVPMVNNSAHIVEDSAAAAETLRLELERCQRELEGCRLRMGDLEQGEMLLAGEKRVLEMIARSSPLVPILDALCRLVEEVSSGSLATILLLDSESNRLWHAAAPSLPPAYTEGMGEIVIGPSVGSCGTAAYRKEPVLVCDIAADPLWADFRDVALAHGLRASWSTPIFSSSGNLLGTFAILSREPRSPTVQHHRLIEQITHLASIAIERNRTETALQESEERFRRMADAISVTVHD